RIGRMHDDRAGVRCCRLCLAGTALVPVGRAAAERERTAGYGLGSDRGQGLADPAWGVTANADRPIAADPANRSGKRVIRRDPRRAGLPHAQLRFLDAQPVAEGRGLAWSRPADDSPSEIRRPCGWPREVSVAPARAPTRLAI